MKSDECVDRCTFVAHMLVALAIFLVSLTALIKGSDWFIGSSERIGLSLGISPFVIGVTVIAFGTSLPELATSIVSVWEGESEVVVGNVLGSNITNLLLIIGTVALIKSRLVLKPSIMDIDIPMLLGSSLLLLFTLWDLHLTIVESILLLSGFTLFIIQTIGSNDSDNKHKSPFKWRDVGLLILGGALVCLGASYTIQSLISLASTLSINTGVIAVSLVALGTSLPEMVVSITAAKRGQSDIAVGNIVGSNIFNSFAVMSIPRFFGELNLPSNVVEFNLILMMGVTLLFAFMCVSRQISRWEGGLLLLLYLYFVINLINQS